MTLSKLMMFACIALATVFASAKENTGQASLDKNGIRETFTKNQADIQACANENPTVKGKLALDCDIDENGKALNIKANEQSSFVKDEKMVTCLKNKMASWEFPKSSKGQVVHISYPLAFSK